jgi:hypothetical protein
MRRGEERLALLQHWPGFRSQETRRILALQPEPEPAAAALQISRYKERIAHATAAEADVSKTVCAWLKACAPQRLPKSLLSQHRKVPRSRLEPNGHCI